MSYTKSLIYAVILCCIFSTSFGRRHNHRWHTRSASNYLSQQPTVASPNADLYKHRSPVCLIHQLAQKNNISVEYELINDPLTTQMPAASVTPKPASYGYRLHLGSETYRAAAPTKSKAKDKVSREAYDKTKYVKPHLKDRTCVENGTRTIVSILYEFAAVNGTILLDREMQIEVVPAKFRVELALGRLSAWGEGPSKKLAKREAAAKIVAMLGKDYVLHEITKKYNLPLYLDMSPVERLNLILYARSEPLAKYTLNDELGDLGSTTYVSKVETETGDSVGTGRTLEQSREDAANNLLKALGFTTKP